MISLRIHHRTTYRYRSPVGFGPHRLMLRPRESRELRLTGFELTVCPQAKSPGRTTSGGMRWRPPPSRPWAIRSRLTASHGSSSTPSPGRSSTSPHPPSSIPSVIPTTTGPISGRSRCCSIPTPTGGCATGRAASSAGPPPTRWRCSRTWAPASRPRSSTRAGTKRAPSRRSRLSTAAGARAAISPCCSPRPRAAWASGPDRLGLSSRPDARRDRDGATHAWAEVFVPGAGWITFDPTNRSVGGGNLIPVAVARDISQAVPVAGSFVGAPDALLGMTVEVSVTA